MQIGRPGLNACAAALAAVLVAGHALAQGAPPTAQPDSSTDEAKRKAGEIISQPARDVGMSKAEIPPVLVKAVQAPYSLQGVGACKQLTATIGELNEALGPDFEAGVETKENRGAKLAEAGGKTVVNSLIPFRGLVREISGAAPAQRSLNAAVDAGLARRGFLRGVYLKQGCRPAL